MFNGWRAIGNVFTEHLVCPREGGASIPRRVSLEREGLLQQISEFLSSPCQVYFSLVYLATRIAFPVPAVFSFRALKRI